MRGRYATLRSRKLTQDQKVAGQNPYPRKARNAGGSQIPYTKIKPREKSVLFSSLRAQTGDAPPMATVRHVEKKSFLKRRIKKKSLAEKKKGSVRKGKTWKNNDRKIRVEISR